MNNIQLSSQKGVGLIEVLVSLVLLAIGILGFASLQMNSVKATSESAIRTDAINLMRDVAERSRNNIEQLGEFKTQLNNFDDQFNGGTASSPTITLTSGPSNKCGLGDSQFCSNEQLATLDAYLTAKKAVEQGFRIQIHTCPGSAGHNTMQTECLIASWNETLPKYGADDDSNDADGFLDCADATNGIYHQPSDCIVMEML